MWDGPGQGPRGRPPFRGNHHGDMFGRDRPMPDFRGRDGMMGPMGHMGPRPLDLPPMDMRRMEGPPLGCRDMDPRDMRGREPHRDYYRPDHGPDFNFRGHYDGEVGDSMMNSPGYFGPGRNSADMGGRDMQNSRFMGTGGRDAFPDDVPWSNYPNMDGRRGFPMDRMDNRHVHRDTRPPVGIGDNGRFNMDTPPRERRMMDLDRRGPPPPFNHRGGFDSDMDFRKHPAAQAEFGGRDRSPLRFGNDVPPKDRTRSDIPVNAGELQRSDLTGTEDLPGMRAGPESSGSPLMDYRSGEEMTLAEEWKNRQKDKNPYPDINKSTEGPPEPAYPSGFRREVNSRDPPPFAERDRPPFDFPGKDVHFSHGGPFAPVGRDAAAQDTRLLARTPLPGTSVGENKDKHWRPQRDSQSPHKAKLGEPFRLDKNLPAQENVKPNDSFKGLDKGLPHSEAQNRGKMEELGEFQSSSMVQAKDQDYRDIDYRTGSGRNFEYKQEDLQATQLIKDSKPAMPLEFSESGSKDQDYRNASVEDKLSTTISIFGIPKTATMEQILGAFTVRDGVPQQGMKIKSVVPGYSYDTAYVEFLNLEDAVHFMESNKGSLKVGTRAVSMSYTHPDEHDRSVNEPHPTLPPHPQSQLSRPEQPLEDSSLNGSAPACPAEPLPPAQWQRNSDLTPEAWQQQVDQQFQQQESEKQAEPWGNHNAPQHNAQQSKSVFKDSKTMIIKNIKPTTTVETILKALDPFAYLDERNVRLIKAKTPGAKCFCFVDMDSHEQVTRLVDLLLTKPVPLYIDDVRVYAEVARPLKNQNFRREPDKPNSSSPGYPPPAAMMEQQQHLYRPPPFLQPPPGMPAGSSHPPLPPDPSQGLGYDTSQTLDPSYHAAGAHVPADPTAGLDQSQSFPYDADTPDMSSYLYDATSGFYYDPETTLYFDPGSRYFYNAQNQEYLYWDAAAKTYVPVPGGNPAENQPVAMTAEDQAILSNPAADAPLDMKKPSAPPFPTTAPPPAPVSATGANQEPVPSSTPSSEKKDDEESARKDKDNKEEKPKSLAAVKIMKDMERWAKIQNRQKEGARAPSPLMKSGADDDRRQSKSADAGFAIFERKNSAGEDLFKKPLAPAKKESKRPMGSLGMLASDYAAGSDEEVEEDKEEVAKSGQAKQCEDKEDKLTDWKKMACLLCRRQFPNKDALVRHQQLSDLHKQNMEIHLKIKRSKKELEALENQEKEMTSRESVRSPEQKKRKHHHHQQPSQHQNSWAGASREANKVGERPGLGSEPPPPQQQRRRQKEHAAWDHATYKQAVRKAMFARFKELE